MTSRDSPRSVSAPTGDRAILQHGKTVREAMKYEWRNGQAPMHEEAVEGAARFAGGLGRHGGYEKI